MSLRLKADLRVFVYSEYVDLRAGFDKLSMLVREKVKANLVDGDLYLFLGKNRKKLKAICYDGTGLLLIAKRMERGRFMCLEELEKRNYRRGIGLVTSRKRDSKSEIWSDSR